MLIQLENISKRFQEEWIIQDFSFTFSSGKVYGIKGINGSGKSTLLKLLSGSLSPSIGVVHFSLDGKNIDSQNIYKHVTYAAAEDELVEELTIVELLNHFSQFTELSLSAEDFMKDYAFVDHKNKHIASYSSGMKQRLKLGIAICANKSVKLFDEPSSYLDAQNKELFYTKLKSARRSKDLICIASNDEDDFAFCDEVLRL